MRWLTAADRDGLEQQERLAAMIGQRFGLNGPTEADVLAELRGGLIRKIVSDDAVIAALRAARAAGWVPYVVTNGTVQQQTRKLRSTGLDREVAGWVISGGAGIRKPDQEIFRYAVFNGRPMILNFDVDCGELIPGHHFIARGLGGPTRLSISDYWDEDGDIGEYEQMLALEEAGGYPGFSLEYELVPGVSAVEAEGPGAFFRFLVGVDYEADVKLPWHPNDGGAIAPFEGGTATHGSRGDWPLPPDATVLTFSLAGVNADGFADHQNPAGDLVVDVVRGEAAWRPR